MKKILSKEDIDRINKKVRRDEHVEIRHLLTTKVKQNKKKYSRKNKKGGLDIE